MIPVLCPKCLTAYRVADDGAGKRATCPACGARVTVRRPGGAKGAGPGLPVLLVGLALLGSALALDHHLADWEVQQRRVSGSTSTLVPEPGDQALRLVSPHADRRLVYLLAVLGAGTLALGLVQALREARRTCRICGRATGNWLPYCYQCQQLTGLR